MPSDRDRKTCARCLYTEDVPDIRFDGQGMCNYCRDHDTLREKYFTGASPANKQKFCELIEKIKREGKGRVFDCIVPMSGGIDSSYVLLLAKKHGLRPIAYTIDNGWMEDVALHNIFKITSTLGVPHKFIPLDRQGMMDLYRAALLASIPEICLPCQVATYSYMYKISRALGVKYVFFGLSPTTEGIAPVKWGYMDGRYLESIAGRFCSGKGIMTAKAFNSMTIESFILPLLSGRNTTVIQMPLYEEWNDEKIRAALKSEVGWIDGGEHHFDCLYSRFSRYFINKKFGFDLKEIQYSALVRSGQISKEEAVRRLREEHAPKEDKDLISLILARLGLTEMEYLAMLAVRPNTFENYHTYYHLLVRVKWVIRLLARLRVFPETTAEKFFSGR